MCEEDVCRWGTCLVQPPVPKAARALLVKVSRPTGAGQPFNGGGTTTPNKERKKPYARAHI